MVRRVKTADVSRIFPQNHRVKKKVKATLTGFVPAGLSPPISSLFAARFTGGARVKVARFSFFPPLPRVYYFDELVNLSYARTLNSSSLSPADFTGKVHLRRHLVPSVTNALRFTFCGKKFKRPLELIIPEEFSRSASVIVRKLSIKVSFVEGIHVHMRAGVFEKSEGGGGLKRTRRRRERFTFFFLARACLIEVLE